MYKKLCQEEDEEEQKDQQENAGTTAATAVSTYACDHPDTVHIMGLGAKRRPLLLSLLLTS